ncbi:MAG: Hint domain-containing protein [Candidatus Levyibacteriota bacterium]
MRLLIGIVIFICVVTGLFFWFNSANPPVSQVESDAKSGLASVGEIRAGMQLGKDYHEITAKDTKIDVGGEGDQKFSPEVEISKLDGEAKFKIAYPETNSSPTAENNTIRWKDQEKEVYFADAQKDGKFEFDILLKQKPVSNIFTYSIDTTGLDFFYQPPLTEKEKKEGNVRPENVVGSYAVYYKDGKSGDYSKTGGKNYGTGKAFHIYRPKIIDAKGNSVWGVLGIDEKAKTLSVTVDPDFLASAAYPVTVDPTFGYTSAGASSVAMNNSIKGSYWSMPEAGTPTMISAYIQSSQTCFTGDTLITMADGSYKQIKDIQLGDKVQSFNEKIKKMESDTVVTLFHHKPEEMGDYYLVVTTSNGKDVGVTPNHRVYREGDWVEATYLHIGDKLFSDKGHVIAITGIKKVYKKVPTYNISIKNNHVYFANFLVHNAKPSFLAGTKISMADSSEKNIEDVKAGEKVKVFNFKTGFIEASSVSQVLSREHDSYLLITDSSGNTLKVTQGHPLFVNGRWQLARQVKVKDRMRSEYGDVEVQSIQEVNEKNVSFNLIVPEYHNYYANGKLVDDESKAVEAGDIAAGSNVLTESGYKNVEDIEIGERLVTYNTATHSLEQGSVTSFQIGLQRQGVYIINNKLSLAGYGTIYTAQGEKKVKDLEIGDELIGTNGEYVKVESLLCSHEADTYAIGVSGNHNLFIDGFLVHNYSGYAKTAIYKQSDNTQVITSAEDTFTESATTTTAWRTFSITGGPQLSASTNYWLYTWGSVGTLDSLNLYYDSGGNGVNKTVTYGAWPDPLTGQTTDSNKYSIYTTYTVPPTPTPTPAPTTLHLQVNTAADDWCDYPSFGDFEPGNFDLRVGRTLSSWDIGMCFNNVTVPRGANIVSATLTYTASLDQSNNTMNTTIYGVDADNPTTPTTDGELWALPTTSASVVWNAIPAWTTNIQYASPDIKAVIQEIVNRSGFASGNKLCLEHFGDGSSGNALRLAYTYDANPAKAATLDISYYPPPQRNLRGNVNLRGGVKLQ